MSENAPDPSQQLPPSTVAASQQAPPPTEATTSAAKKKKNKKKKKKKTQALSVVSASDATVEESESREETPMESEVETDQLQQHAVETPASVTPGLPLSEEEKPIEVDESVQTLDESIPASVPQPETVTTEIESEPIGLHSEPEQRIETPPEPVASTEVAQIAHEQTSESVDRTVNDTIAPHSAPWDSDAHTSLENESSNDSLFANNNDPLPWTEPQSATTIPESHGSNIESLGTESSASEQVTPVVESPIAIQTEPTQSEPVSTSIDQELSPLVHTVETHTIPSDEAVVPVSLDQESHQEAPATHETVIESPVTETPVVQKPGAQESSAGDDLLQQPTADFTSIPKPVSEKAIDAPSTTPHSDSSAQSASVSIPAQPIEALASETAPTSALPWESQSPSEFVRDADASSDPSIASLITPAVVAETPVKTEPVVLTPAQPQEPEESSSVAPLPWESSVPSEGETARTETEMVPTETKSVQEENPFASSSAAPLPWESSISDGTVSTETKTIAQQNTSASLSATPLPWESSGPVVQSAKVDDLESKFSNLDLQSDALLDQETAHALQPEEREPVTSAQTHSNGTFGDVKQDFATMIGQNEITAPEQAKEKPANKFSFMDLDDEMLDDDLLPEEPVAVQSAQSAKKPLQLVQPEPAASQQKYQPVVQQPQQQTQFYQPVQAQQNFYQQQHQVHQPPPAHHLDVKKLNAQKQKSDAYDFPMDLVPQKHVHKPAKVQSSVQMNQQYQSSQSASVPPRAVSSGPQGYSASPVSNPYAPQSQVTTPGVTVQQNHVPGPPGGVYGKQTGPPPVIKKKQSSFFEELPLPPIPVKKSRVPSSVASMSPNMSSAVPTHQYGVPPLRPGMAPLVGPPKNILKPPSRPPSRPPAVAQRQGSISSVTTSPLISSSIPQFAGGPPNPYAPHGGVQQQNMYAPQEPQQQQQIMGAQYAPPQVSAQQLPQGAASQSRYAPVVQPTGMGGLAPPPHGNFRQPSIPGQAQPGQIPPSPQPQFSSMIDNKNPYAQAAMSGQAVPLTSAMAGAQPGTHGLPQIQTTGPVAYGQSSIDAAVKSPTRAAVTPSSTRYAPINHRRQQSTSATQYDPYSAHKFQQKKIEEEHAHMNAPPQHQYGQHSLAPPAPGYGPPQSQYAPQSMSMPVAPQAAPQVALQGYASQASQVYAPGQARSQQQQQQLPQSNYPTHQSGYSAPQQQNQYDGMTKSVSNPEQLLQRQFPIFSWSNTSKIVSFIPSMQYGAQPGIRIMKTEEVLQDISLKEFQSVSKKNIPSIEKFLDGQFERVAQRHDMTVNDELLLIQLLKHKITKVPGAFNLGGVINYTETSGSSFNENFNKPKAPLNKRMLVSQISNGDTQEALNLALSHHDYPLALLISSIISRESWFGIVENYFNHEFKGDQDHFLPVLFRILSGDYENVMKLLSTDPQKRDWALLNWRSIATSVITNNPACLPQFLSMFAQFLVQNNQLIPAYIILILSDAPVAVFPACRSVSSTLYLELYGNFLLEKIPALDLSNVFLQHASLLVDYDMLTEAQKYVDTANAAFRASKRVDPVFMYITRSLSARLSGAGVEGGWFAKPKLDRVWGTLDKGLNKLISGDEPQSETKDNALFSKFSPAVSRSGSMVSMNFTPGADFQNQARGQISSSPYAPSNITGTLPPVRPYVPATAGRASVSSTGGLQQNYTPPQFSHNMGSVSSSPKPVRPESTTTSPMHKNSRYAGSIESGSRRSSVHSHTSGPEDLIMKPPAFFGAQNGSPYQPAPSSVNRQLGSPAMTSATPSYPSQPQQAPPLISSPPVVGTPPIAGPPKLGPKVGKTGPPRMGSPRGARPVFQSGVSLDDLISQEKPHQHQKSVQALSRPPVVVEASAYTPPIQSTQPVVEEQPQPRHSQETFAPEVEAPFADESTLNQSHSSLLHSESGETGSRPAETEVDGDAPVPESVLDDAVSTEEASNQGIEAPVDYEDKQDDEFDPETPHKEDYFGRTVASVTQSEMGSTSATPYVVPESVLEEHHVQEDVPEDIQERIPESNVSTQPTVFNPYAPPAAPASTQKASPYAPSPYVPGSSPTKPPMKSTASGRFTPKSYTPSNDLPPTGASPIVSGDVDFYSIGGYKQAEPTAPAPPSEPLSTVPEPPVVSPVVAHQQLPQSSRGSAANAYAPQSPVQNRSRQSSLVSPLNPYAPQPQQQQKSYSPVQNNFKPYQPSAGTESSSRSSSLGAMPHVPNNQESRFAPMSAASDNSNVSSMMAHGLYEPTSSSQYNSYEPPSVHAITSIPEDDETYEDYVEEEDSDDDDVVSTKKEPVKEEKKTKKSKNSDNLESNDGQGWFGGWFKKDKNGPTVYKAKLGESNNFVYDEKLKRWVDKNASPEELQASVTPPPPPPIIKKKPSTIGKPRSDSVSESGPVMGGPSKMGPPGGSVPPGPPMMSNSPSPAPPSAGGPPKKSAVSDLDSLLSAGGNNTRRKKKSGRGYVNVMGTMGAEK